MPLVKITYQMNGIIKHEYIAFPKDNLKRSVETYLIKKNYDKIIKVEFLGGYNYET